MSGKRGIWLVVGLFLALITGIVLSRGLPPATPNPPGTFSFAVLGDAPYYPWEDLQYPLLLREINSYDLSWVVHVGDVFWHPCTDELYQRSLGWFNSLGHPVIYTPGDNEWADCWEPGSGSYAPQERLHRIRQIFFANPTRTLGGRTLSLSSQGGREPYPEFVENFRWTHEGFVFATVHLVGSMNGLEPTEVRTADDILTSKRRTEAAAAWLRETFSEARERQAFGVVIGFHGNMDLEEPPNDPYRQAFEPFITALEEEVELFAKPVLAVHGDGHEYTVDHPLLRRTTLRRLENFTRLQVPGSSQVGWVRVLIKPGAPGPFSFEEHTLPSWKYW